jgi:hypothetical protein
MRKAESLAYCGIAKTRRHAPKGNTLVTFWVRSAVTDGAILLAQEGTIYVTNCEQRAVAGKPFHGKKPQ